MSHPVNDELNDKHMEVIGAFLSQICAFRAQFADYIAKYELYEMLTKNEAEFMNEIAISCQKFLDTELINQAKEQKKSNGNMGQ